MRIFFAGCLAGDFEKLKLENEQQISHKILNSISSCFNHWKLKKSDEEQWSLRQKLTSFEVDKRGFEKEKEFYRTQLAAEQQKLNVIE